MLNSHMENECAPPDDLDGLLRDAAPDIGAYEYLAPVGLLLFEKAPDTPDLPAAYPNPFNADTVIVYDLPRCMRVRLSIYDALGRCCRALYEGEEYTGRHTVRWECRDDDGWPSPSGIYFCRVEAEQVLFRNMQLLR